MKMISENRVSPSTQQGEYREPKRVDVEVVEENHLPVSISNFEQRFTETFTGLVENTQTIYNGMSPSTLTSIDAVNVSASFDLDNPSSVSINIAIKHK